jgi:cell division protease FtsH
MVTEYGMSDHLGPMRFGHPQGEVFLGRDFTSTPDYSDEVASSIDAEVRALIESAHASARSVLAENRDVLDRIAGELIEHETLEAERVQELFSDVRHFDSAGTGGGRATLSAASAAPTAQHPPSSPIPQIPPTHPGGAA